MCVGLQESIVATGIYITYHENTQWLVYSRYNVSQRQIGNRPSTQERCSSELTPPPPAPSADPAQREINVHSTAKYASTRCSRTAGKADKSRETS